MNESSRGLRGRTFVVSPADPYADNEVKLVSLIGLAVLVTVSGVGRPEQVKGWPTSLLRFSPTKIFQGMIFGGLRYSEEQFQP